VNPFVSASLSDLIMKCLEKVPEKRFQTGRELVDALQRMAAEPSPKTSVPPPAPEKTRQPRVARLLLTAILVLGLAAAGGYYVWSQRSAPSVAGPGAAGDITPGTDSAPKSSIETATLKISSEPEGANVYVNSVFKGRTPFDVQLPLGKYELRLSMVDHLAWEAQIDLDTPGEMPLRIPMRPAK
jgi:eukaryotic-like serine/threonine-protein kinase